MPRRVAIVVAMEREVEPLLRSWKQEREVKAIEVPGMMPGARAYRHEDTTVICAGIGKKAAAAAAKAAIDSLEPDVIISAGLAGALEPELKVGAILKPAEVVNSANGDRITVEGSPAVGGLLLTAAAVLSKADKKELAKKFRADLVDMEAAVVAEIARAAGVQFMAVKAISDEADFDMPPMDKFIDAQGRLDLLKLIGWALVRPRAWGPMVALRRNTRVAAQALANELERLIADECR